MATHSSREAEKVNILRIKEKDSWGKMLCWSPIVSVTVYIELFLVTMSHLFFSSYFFSFTVRSLQLLYHYVGFKILSLSLFLTFWLCHMACRIFVPQPWILPTPPAVEGWSLNHWTTKKVP